MTMTFPVYSWARSRPLREDVENVTSSLTGMDHVQPLTEDVPRFITYMYIYAPQGLEDVNNDAEISPICRLYASVN